MRPLDIRDAFSVLCRRRRLIAATVLAVIAGTVVGNYLTYPVFQSTVKILVQRPPGTDIPLWHEQIAFKKAEIIQTQCELLQSLPVLEETVRRLELDQRPLPSGSFRDRVHGLWRGVLAKYQELKFEAKRLVIERVLGGVCNRPPEPDPFRQAVADLRSVLQVEPIPSTDLIKVTISDYDATFAARVANMIAEIYLEHDVAAQKERARLIYKLVDEQVTRLKPEYDAALEALEEFEEKHEARLIREKIRSHLSEISQLEVAYANLVGTQSSKILSLTLELARLEQTYEPSHPKVAAARSELEEARRQLGASTTGGDVANGTVSKEAGPILERIARARQELAELNRLDGEYSRLQDRQKQEEELFLTLKKRREEAQVAEATRAAGTRVIEGAVPAIQPSAPRKMLNLLLALLGGAFLAAAITALLEFLDRSVRTPADVVRVSGVDAVWSIPERRRSWIFGSGT